MILSVYRCEEAINDDLSQSFFYRDCSQFCYKGKHKQFIIVTTILFMIYLPLSIYLRPYWQSNQKEVNIETSSSYFSFLSVFQLLLVLIKINTESYSEEISGFFILACLAIMSGITMIINPYNYKRAMVLQVTTLMMAFFSVGISTFSFIYKSGKIFTIVLVSGTGLIMLIGIGLSSKYPNYFIADYADSIPLLMKLQFLPNFGKKLAELKYFASQEKANIQDSTKLKIDSTNKFN